MKLKNYKDLNVWKKGIEIVDLVYKAIEKFPVTEKYILCNQIQRSSISIPSNIAEGFNRQYTKEFKQFCYIALGSCAELETQLEIANKRNYLQKEDYDLLKDYIDHESRMLMNLIKSLGEE